MQLRRRHREQWINDYLDLYNYKVDVNDIEVLMQAQNREVLEKHLKHLQENSL